MFTNFSTDGFFRVVFPWRTTYLVQQMAGEVARNCQADLWRRVCRRTASMSAAEIRGYVIAHAAGCMESEVNRTFSRRGFKPALRIRVIDAAVNQLVDMVVHNVLSGASQAATRTLAA